MSPLADITGPLCGIETIGKLLAAHAVEDPEGTGTLLLEYVAAIKAAVVVASGDGVIGVPGGRAFAARRWPTEERSRAILAALRAVAPKKLTLRELARAITFPIFLSGHESQISALRHGVQHLVAAGEITEERTGPKLTDARIYGLPARQHRAAS